MERLEKRANELHPVFDVHERQLLREAATALRTQPSDRGEVSEQQRREIAFDVKREIRYAFRRALAELPEIAPPEISVLLASVQMNDAFMTEGKRLQWERGTDAVPPRVEQECAAGAWSFMRQGVLAALEPSPPAGEGVTESEAANIADAIIRQVRRTLAAEFKHANYPHGSTETSRDDADFEYTELTNFTLAECDAALAIVRRRRKALAALYKGEGNG